MKIRSLRPFDEEEVARSLAGAKAVGVLDRSISFGAPGGPVHKEIKAALYGSGVETTVVNYIYGLGGRDISTEHIRSVFGELENLASEGKPDDNIRFVGLREGE